MQQKLQSARVAAFAVALAVITLGVDAMAAACTQSPDEIVVRISNLRNDSGNVVAELYPNDPANFLKGRARIERAFQPAVAEGTVDVCLTPPEPGIYAVAVYHDENANVKFDKNWIGLPSEGYGISNNPTVFLRAPIFDEAKFEALEGATVVPVEIRY
ncbi:MAG: DUF2141 domain-containing protein [Proteobacteria bacterium]|nr:DUF2141 domain-containing protein [Pseudomonadota bacterium]